jgi:hypothetical protein
VEAVESARAGLSPKKGDVRKERRIPRKAGLSPKKKGDVRKKKKTKEGGLSPQEGDVRKKEKKKTKEGKKVAPQRQGSVCPQPRMFFFWFTSIWVWKRPVLFEVSAPTRLSLRGSHVRRKFRKRTTLRSESSTLKGLLYAPIKREQYHKRTPLRRLKIPLRM